MITIDAMARPAALPMNRVLLDTALISLLSLSVSRVRGQVAELLIYLALTADLESAATNWKPIAVLAAVAAMPLIYSRSIIDTKC